ncbi:hypothetical protein CEUSTIGMA_g4844.t1 [Chlamydomonas eustigma]|uniref:Guanylate cyclase domain-containing protein n=1 Tax=Chlamydomonas eustigma TaxID=1157962 RepID=A0A250X2V2_9CHLO|nr:hypothetical protein CEUSTIGMA_g4844.t1 [Chlamydomonas eustigma]|eukprot:GAX77398.1 hypothetical protein CEUSTIGMA_g4844.t1 [Chlamydomonas eustigma]
MEPVMSYTESPPVSPSVYSQRNKDMGAGPFHVYQVLPTRLQARGAYFGSKITLPDEFKMVLKPYYDAPGARQTAPSSYRRLSTMAPTPTLPTVTIVFVMVEPCDGLTKTIASDIHKELLTLICSILRQIPGSYLVLEQEGDLKYMSAFDSAEAACSFCLAVQECSMYVLWSKTVLSLWPEQWDKISPGNHQLLFRGPRLKMGVCEGVPGSIMPNHLGRADYHGACVNQAARFMDAAAHGGQIACEENTATRVMDAWAAQARAMEQREREEEEELFCDPAPDVFHSCSHNAVFGSPDSTAPEDSPFPKQPPKGKGSQVSQGTGIVLASAQACELRIVSEYRHLFQGVATAASSLLLSRGESSSKEDPLCY